MSPKEKKNPLGDAEKPKRLDIVYGPGWPSRGRSEAWTTVPAPSDAREKDMNAPFNTAGLLSAMSILDAPTLPGLFPMQEAISAGAAMGPLGSSHSHRGGADGDIHVPINLGDALDFYSVWERPTCIIADGPYGLGKFPGEPNSIDALPAIYEPHVKKWAQHARPDTTLWFWNTEIGWATVHPILAANGWEYQETIIWDKGIAHVAGNCNSKTIRGVPVVSEVAVRYTRKTIMDIDGLSLSIQEWIRHEWMRSGLSMSLANQACQTKSAATRKYLTADRLWYFPPADAMVAMAKFCTDKGIPTERPYFSLDGVSPLTTQEWERMRAKWFHQHGISNVWQVPAVHGGERIRGAGTAYAHANQKPLALMARQIEMSTELDDVIWEPFGGLCSATIAALRTGRQAFAAEINKDYHKIATARYLNEVQRLSGG